MQGRDALSSIHFRAASLTASLSLRSSVAFRALGLPGSAGIGGGVRGTLGMGLGADGLDAPVSLLMAIPRFPLRCCLRFSSVRFSVGLIVPNGGGLHKYVKKN